MPMPLIGEDEWLRIVDILSIPRQIPTPTAPFLIASRPLIVPEDKKALDCLASVCTMLRSMVQSMVQQNSFRYIVLDSPKAIKDIESTPRRVPINHLEITAKGSRFPLDSPIELCSDMFIDFISRCKHLESLYLTLFAVDYQRWDFFIDRMKENMVFANVTKLDYGGIRMQLRYFQQFVSLMPMLKWLSFGSVVDDEPGTEDPSPLPLPPFHLETLAVCNGEAFRLQCYAWLLSNSKNTVHELEMIAVENTGAVFRDLMVPLNNGVGQSLRSLRLQIVEFEVSEIRQILKQCVNLEELAVDLAISDGGILSYLEALRKPLRHLYVYRGRSSPVHAPHIYEFFTTALQQNHPKLAAIEKLTLRFRWDNEDHFKVASNTLQQVCEARKVEFIEMSLMQRE